MEITFNELKSKDIINIYDGKRLGKAMDISFDKQTGSIIGIVVPGERRMFKKPEDIFIPIHLIKKIGEDVLLVKLAPDSEPQQPSMSETSKQSYSANGRTVYARYKRVVEKEK